MTREFSADLAAQDEQGRAADAAGIRYVETGTPDAEDLERAFGPTPPVHVRCRRWTPVQGVLPINP